MTKHNTYLSNMSNEEKLKYIFEPCALADINYSSIDELLTELHKRNVKVITK